MGVGHGQSHVVSATIVVGMAGVLVGAGIAIAEVPVPLGDVVAPGSGLVGKIHRKRRTAARHVGREVCRRPFIGRDVVFLGLGITAAMGVGHGQSHVVSAIIVGMAGVLQGAVVSIAEVPVPGDDGVISSCRQVGKLHC